MPDMTPTSFVAIIAPRTDKMIKNGLERVEHLRTKWYTTLKIYVKSIGKVRTFGKPIA